MRKRTGTMSMEEAVRLLRADPNGVERLEQAYLGGDLEASAKRFFASGEFSEVLRLVGDRITGAKVLDLGAGNGIASRAFALSGAERVYALEPDPSDEVGRGAVARLTAGLPVEPIDAVAEAIPLPDGHLDLVYARSVLHHIGDLPAALAECVRVLKPGGVFLACREHVVDDERQLATFRRRHALHRLTGGENAYRLDAYLAAIAGAGLVLERVVRPWETLINAYPVARTPSELERLPQQVLAFFLGRPGAVLARVPGVPSLVRAALRRPYAGRLYTFLARKPSRPATSEPRAPDTAPRAGARTPPS